MTEKAFFLFIETIIPSFQYSNIPDMFFSLCAMLSARGVVSSAGLHTDAADVMAEMEGF
jgi:hypothetical protein